MESDVQNDMLIIERIIRRAFNESREPELKRHGSQVL